jgi:transcriptional regulator GlxA family with amidase domain
LSAVAPAARGRTRAAAIAGRRVVLLAYEHMNVLDLCGPLQAFTTARRNSPPGTPPRYETIVASADGGLVTTGSGLAIATVPVETLDTCAIDTLVVPGGCKGETYSAPRKLIEWVARRAPDVRRLCSVCTGAFLLAEAGQLEGKTVATHWDWVTRLRTLHPDIAVDATRYSCATAPFGPPPASRREST